jgi:hypothetical protein
MAARFARPIALARLGTSHHEPSLLAGRKKTVERTLLALRRRIPSLCRKRFDETTPHPEAKPFGAFSVRGNHSDVLNRDVLS